MAEPDRDPFCTQSFSSQTFVLDSLLLSVYSPTFIYAENILYSEYDGYILNANRARDEIHTHEKL